MRRTRTLFVHDSLPAPDRSGAEKRILLLLEEIAQQGHAITFLARWGKGREEELPAVQRLCERVYHTDLEHLRYLGHHAQPQFRLSGILEEGDFDLAILTHWHWNCIAASEQYLQKIRLLSPRTRIAVLSEDHHGWREARLAQISGEWQDWERARDYEERELEIYRLADVVLAVSTADRDGILRLAPDAPIEVLPPVADEVETSAASFEQRRGILFLGQYDNPANRDGIDWFLADVWPLALAREPDLRLSLAGPNWPDDYLKHRNVEALGFLRDLGPAFARHRLAICPIRYGTGIKTKNLPALAYGLPLVTTSVGAEGMGLTDGIHAAIADHPDEFAARLVELYRERSLWHAMAGAARALAEATLSRAALSRRMREVISATLSRPAKAATGLGLHSPLSVEIYHPEVLDPGGDAFLRRTQAYLDLGDRRLEEGKLQEARAQFRHALTFLRNRHHPLMARIEAGLCRCAPAPEADYFAPLRRRPPAAPRRAGAASAPLFSAIIPTYNRRPVLQKCLEALAAQSTSPDRFEAIVIDDGSSDDTESWCRSWSAPFPLTYIRQDHAGVGAARRAGVVAARGEYLWLANDDTIAAPGLLAAHAAAWQRLSGTPLAILGDFRYSFGAARRALSYTLSRSPFLFPQLAMEPHSRHDCTMFMTCNLSVRRAAVLEAGNFDPRFRVAEDTELGARLESAGYAVQFEPAAIAWHDHLDFRCDDVVARARRYGPAILLLHRLHPRLLGDGRGRLGRLDAASFDAMRRFLDRHRDEVAAAVHALRRYDDLDFLPFFAQPRPDGNAAGQVAALIAAALPTIHWFYVYESLLAAHDATARPAPTQGLSAPQPALPVGVL